MRSNALKHYLDQNYVGLQAGGATNYRGAYVSALTMFQTAGDYFNRAYTQAQKTLSDEKKCRISMEDYIEAMGLVLLYATGFAYAGRYKVYNSADYAAISHLTLETLKGMADDLRFIQRIKKDRELDMTASKIRLEARPVNIYTGDLRDYQSRMSNSSVCLHLYTRTTNDPNQVHWRNIIYRGLGSGLIRRLQFR